MRYIVTILSVLLFSNFSMAEGRTGNGGGGIIVNGNYITVPEANISIEGHLLLDVPALQLVNRTLWLLNISPSIYRNFLPTLNPSSTRSYYSVANIDANQLLAIKRVYSRTLHVPIEKVVIYAVTDSNTRKTFLLPEFFKLTEEQQASVLFHEWLWILNSEMSYEDVMYGESLFFAFYHDANYRWDELSLFLAQATGNPQIALSPALSRWTSLHETFGENILNSTLVACLNKSAGSIHATDEAQSCLYDWALYLEQCTIEKPIGMGDRATPLMSAISSYFRMGGIIEADPILIPTGWEKFKAIGANSNIGESLQFYDEKNQLIFQIKFPVQSSGGR